MKDQESATNGDRLGTAQYLQAAAGRCSVIFGLRSIYPACYVCGRAVTCQCESNDNLAVHVALTMAAAQTVLVCAVPENPSVAFFGELMGIEAKKRGIAGLVIDGLVRDTEELEQMQFPVFSVGTSPARAKKERAGACGVPIRLRGAIVNPNDYVVADRDGVIVVPGAIWAETQQRAREIAAAEAAVRARLAAGERLFDVLGLPVRLDRSRGEI